MDIDEFDFGGEKSTHYTFNSSGTELIFEDEVLVGALVRAQPNSEKGPYGVYPRPAALVQGLSSTSTREYTTEYGMDTAYLTLALAILLNCRTIVLWEWDRP